MRIEAHNDVRRGCATVASRMAFSDGHRAAMEGRPIPEEIQKSETAEARSFKNGHEAGMRAFRGKG
jgi:hypothetical protein